MEINFVSKILDGLKQAVSFCRGEGCAGRITTQVGGCYIKDDVLTLADQVRLHRERVARIEAAAKPQKPETQRLVWEPKPTPEPETKKPSNKLAPAPPSPA